MKTDSYYYNQLNKEQQRAYYCMLEGLRNLAPSFAVPRLTGRELTDIYFFLRLDHPEIFYTVSFSYKYYQESENVILSPEYLFDKKVIKENIAAMQSRVKKLARGAERLSEKDKELYIHDFICKNVTYDKLKKPYSHEIIGALGQGVAVCEGIAKAVKILCDELGIWCIIALAENNPEKGIKYRHAWNIVKIGGKYFHLDCTFDNSLGDKENLRYDYFNVGDKAIVRDHEPMVRPVPPCTEETMSYYREKKLSFTKMEDVKNRAQQAAKKGKVLVFQWRGGYLTREVLADMLEVFAEAGRARGKKPVVSLNRPQAVLQLSYVPLSEEKLETEGAPAAEETAISFTEQEANEGETIPEAG